MPDLHGGALHTRWVGRGCMRCIRMCCCIITSRCKNSHLEIIQRVPPYHTALFAFRCKKNILSIMVSLLFEILGFPNIYISARAHSPAAKWFINFCSKRVPTIHWQPLRFLIVFLSNGKLAKHRKIGQSQQITRFIAMHMQIHKYTNTQIHKYANTQRQRQHRRVGHQQQVTGFM